MQGAPPDFVVFLCFSIRYLDSQEAVVSSCGSSLSREYFCTISVFSQAAQVHGAGCADRKWQTANTFSET